MSEKNEGLGLVLEGGGMRGVFTAGVLDFFLEENFFVDKVIGVSAGAVEAVNFVSRQEKRGYRVIATYARDKRYMSFRSLLLTGDLFNKKFCYERIPDELDPFDYATFRGSPMRTYATATNVLTGEASYLELSDLRLDMEKLRASGSLPLVSNLVKIDGIPFLDGGIADSIPFRAMLEMGCSKCVVVLTRDASYRKTPNRLMPLIRLKYRKYPRFVAACENRFRVYNETLDALKEAEARGEAFIIRPQKKVEVGRLEKDARKLEALYDEGFDEAKNRFEDLKRFIGKM